MNCATIPLPMTDLPTTTGEDADDRRALAGFIAHDDRRGLEDLLQRHAPSCWRIARRLTGSAADADDAVQEGFLAAMRSARSYRGTGTVRSWLLAAVANAARMQMRSAARRHLRETGVPATPPPPPEDDRLASVLVALGRLAQDERVAIELHLRDGLGHDEIAALLGLRATAVRKRVSRGLERLRDFLGSGCTATAVVALITAVPEEAHSADLAARTATLAQGGPAAAAAAVGLGKTCLLLAAGSLVVATGLGLAVLAWPGLLDRPAQPPPPPMRPIAVDPDVPRTRLLVERLQLPVSRHWRHASLDQIVGDIAEQTALDHQFVAPEDPDSFDRLNPLVPHRMERIDLAVERLPAYAVLDRLHAETGIGWRPANGRIVLSRPLAAAQRTAWLAQALDAQHPDVARIDAIRAIGSTLDQEAMRGLLPLLADAHGRELAAVILLSFRSLADDRQAQDEVRAVLATAPSDEILLWMAGAVGDRNALPMLLAAGEIPVRQWGRPSPLGFLGDRAGTSRIAATLHTQRGLWDAAELQDPALFKPILAMLSTPGKPRERFSLEPLSCSQDPDDHLALAMAIPGWNDRDLLQNTFALSRPAADLLLRHTLDRLEAGRMAEDPGRLFRSTIQAFDDEALSRRLLSYVTSPRSSWYELLAWGRTADARRTRRLIASLEDAIEDMPRRLEDSFADGSFEAASKLTGLVAATGRPEAEQALLRLWDQGTAAHRAALVGRISGFGSTALDDRMFAVLDREGASDLAERILNVLGSIRDDRISTYAERFSLHGPTLSVRTAAINQLNTVRDPERLGPIILGLIRDGDASIQREALGRLTSTRWRVAGSDRSDIILDLLSTPGFSAELALLDAVQPNQARPARIWDVLRRNLDDPVPAHRAQACCWLSCHNTWRDTPEKHAEGLGYLARAAEHDPHPQVRTAARDALHYMWLAQKDAAAQTLRQALPHDPDFVEVAPPTLRYGEKRILSSPPWPRPDRPAPAPLPESAPFSGSPFEPARLPEPAAPPARPDF